MECRACDAGLVGGQCLLKGVVYAMCCTLCKGLYIGETARPVRRRFAEHCRDAKTLVVRSTWGGHYRSEHRELVKASDFAPFHRAWILGQDTPLPTRRLLEATHIR